MISCIHYFGTKSADSTVPVKEEKKKGYLSVMLGTEGMLVRGSPPVAQSLLTQATFIQAVILRCPDAGSGLGSVGYITLVNFVIKSHKGRI